jgi:hypothetical protein
MITLEKAIEIFRRHCAERGSEAGDPEQQVIERGTYFFFAYPRPVIGSKGVIVDKKDGVLTRLGSSYRIETAFWAYEKGLFQNGIDLVVTSYRGEIDAVIDVLTKNPAFKRGEVYKPGRKGWYARLSTLPAVVFRNVNGLDSYVNELYEAEKDGLFTFEIRKHVPDLNA